ncbi:GAF domain-containing protein [Fervidobacterium sp. 2310opik-2]|nr:GAF domain-containing protein [Fervidobacterium sp. 2310opik-2]HOJ93622.1 GAF domain-containing protein [Fervidobacterium nodosum]
MKTNKFGTKSRFGEKMKKIVFSGSFSIWFIEYFLVMFFVYILFLMHWLNVNIFVSLLIGLVFIWSARHGLLAFIVSMLSFEMIFLYILKKTGNLIFPANATSVYVIVLGLFIGIIGEILNKRLRTTENERKKLEMERKNLVEHIETLKSVISQLELRIYFEGQGMIDLLERLQELEILDLDEMLTRAVSIIAEFFEIENLKLYSVDKYFLRYVAGIGKKNLPNSFEAKNSKVISRALEKGYASLPEVLLEMEIENFEPWFAVSVGRGDDTFGVFVVEDITPDKFSQTLILYMQSIASWLNANIKIVKEETKLLEERFKNTDGTWSEEYYIKKKSVLDKRREKFGIPYEELCLIYDKTIHGSVIKEFRASDIATAKGIGDRVQLKVLLSVCDEIGKKKIIERLVSKYEIQMC